MTRTFGLLTLLLLVSGSAMAASTGSRTGAKGQPLTIVEFDEPSELKAVRAALAAGEPQVAVAHAQSLLARDPSPEARYAGLNALCAARTSAGERDAALDACNSAVAMHPNRWMALNTRGNLHLVTGAPGEAVADFQRALEQLPADSPQADVVRHNLALAQGRFEPAS